MTVTVVIPTLGRASLQRALAPVLGRVPVVVVDDRPDGPPLSLDGVTVLRSGGRGPATARNLGWRHATDQWVAFLDDDVEPPEDWVDELTADLEAADPDVGGVQGRVTVPISARPTDWERSTKGLETAVWATADLAYRRRTLEGVGGFDESFRHAYREDADLGLRVTTAGWRIVTGRRQVVHPVRPARWTQSIRSQRGNADDVRMLRKHGPGWRRRAHVPAGRRPWHVATTAALLAAAVPRWRRPALATWAVLVGDLARRRVAPGPRSAREVSTMLVTSVAIPEVATGWWLLGWWRSS